MRHVAGNPVRPANNRHNHSNRHPSNWRGARRLPYRLNNILTGQTVYQPEALRQRRGVRFLIPFLSRCLHAWRQSLLSVPATPRRSNSRMFAVDWFCTDPLRGSIHRNSDSSTRNSDPASAHRGGHPSWYSRRPVLRTTIEQAHYVGSARLSQLRYFECGVPRYGNSVRVSVCGARPVGGHSFFVRKAMR